MDDAADDRDDFVGGGCEAVDDGGRDAAVVVPSPPPASWRRCGFEAVGVGSRTRVRIIVNTTSDVRHRVWGVNILRVDGGDKEEEESIRAWIAATATPSGWLGLCGIAFD